jgi:hypothetical protein
MLRKAVIVVCLIAVTALCLSGCKKSTPPPSQPKVQTPQMPQAEEEITEENIAEQLEKMEKELEAEAAQEQ